MTFQGFPDEVLDFYEGLEQDNSRAYWLAHKDAYDQHVRGPMLALLTELADEFGEGKVFRPNRDVRFSTDKTAYKDHVGARIGRYGYVEVSAKGLATASGIYAFAPDQLARFRRAVASDVPGEALVRIVADAGACGVTVTSSSTLKTAPRGFDRDHPRIELLRMKSVYAWRQWPGDEWLATPAAKDRVVEVLRAAVPLGRWLDTHVGPTELERPARR